MPTVTTFAEKIKSDNVLAFNGIPGKVSSLEITVEDVCTEYDYPVYYGGNVLGSILEGYRYVEPGTPGSASNYHFGTRMCSSITGKFIGNARMWWEDYRKGKGAKPNCWKLFELNPDVGSTKPASIIEVSLYELLKLYFPEENDEIEASLELKRFRWNPAGKYAVPFSTFRTYSQSLAVRSGYDKWKQRMPLIVQCIEPTALRNSVRLYDEEHKFWFECRITVNTWLNAHPTQPTVIDLTKCDKCGGSHDTDKCRRNAKGSKTTIASSSRGDAVCNWCSLQGHYKNECLRLRGQITRGEVPAEERNRRGGPSTAAAPAARPPAQQRSFLPRGASAATKLVDSNQKRDDGEPDSNPALYFMNTWTPGVSKVANADTKLSRIASVVAADEDIDELFSTRYADQLVEFPVFNNITSPPEVVEVIDNVLGKTAKTSSSAVVKLSDAIDMSALGPTTDECPTGPVWTISSTLRGRRACVDGQWFTIRMDH
ncbi:hypothetical protein EDC01DRAFT_628201 [Geopyxis carbonaria]|nr:hypothetical protein EDC01DRAFT_628201 [Geopyxis carbonaria]